MRPLTANPLERSVTGAAISPDGRYLAYVDPDGLHLRLISSGETRIMELDTSLVPWQVKWYPDGTRLLFLAKVGEEPMSLWSMATLGSRAQLLHAGVYDASISPDGTTLAFTRGAGTQTQSGREIWLAGSGGEDPRLLVTADAEESFWNLAWSPDSRRLAYGSWESSVAIKSCRLDGTDETVLLSGYQVFQYWIGPLPFVWAPDGRLFFGRRERQGQIWDPMSSNIWVVEADVERGVTLGEPRRITQVAGSNVTGLSISDDGQRMVAHLVRNQADIWVGHLDPEGTSFTRETRLTDDDWPDYGPAWSHDSAAVLFSSVRGGGSDILRVAVADGTPRPTVMVSGLETSSPEPLYDPDGQDLLYLSRGRDLLRIPLGGGPPVQVVSGLPLDDVRCWPAGDPACLAGYHSGSEYVFVSLDVETGEAEEVLRIAHHPPFTNWDRSPDGSTLAVVHCNDDTIRLISLPSGEERTVHVKGWASFEFIAWSADGQRLFVNAGFASSGRFPDLLSVDLAGNATVLRHAPSQWHVYPMASPDGSYLAFSSMPFHGNAWLVTGFS